MGRGAHRTKSEPVNGVRIASVNRSGLDQRFRLELFLVDVSCLGTQSRAALYEESALEASPKKRQMAQKCATFNPSLGLFKGPGH